MKKGIWIFILLGCVFSALFILGQAQPRLRPATQNLSLSNRQYDEMKQELAQLKAEVERLAKAIKISGSNIQIDAPFIYLNGNVIVKGYIQLDDNVYSHNCVAH